MLGYFHCHWYVTTHCNSRCKTCSIWKDPKYKSKESNLQERFKLLKQIKDLGFKSVDFTGGEPLLYPGLPKLIAYAHKLGIFTSLTTNGTLYPKYAKLLIGNLSNLSFSLDAPDEEAHDKIRGIKCYNKVIQSMILARKYGELVMLKTTVTNDYIDQIPEIIKLAEKYGVLVELNAEFSYFGNPQLSEKNIQKMYQWWKHPNVIISHAHLQFMSDHGNKMTHSKCPIGKGIIVLSPDDGLYFPCMHMFEKIIQLQDHNLKKTLKSPEVRALISRVGHYDFCANCTIPCYFEAAYYTQLDKYWPICLKSRIGYLRKYAVLSIKNRLNIK